MKDNITMFEYQFRSSRTMPRDEKGILLSDDLTKAIFALGLTGEAGEVAEMIKKHLGHGHSLDVSKLEKELGDVLWYLNAIAEIFNINLEDVALRNIKKLEDRYPTGFNNQDSINRVENLKPEQVSGC